MSTELRQALDKVARRFRRLRLWRGLALCWLVWSILAVGLYLASSRPGYEWLMGQERFVSLAMLAAATGIVCALFASRAARDPRWVARRIEARHPELAAGLLAAVEQSVEDPSAQFGYLQTVVIRQALEHGRLSDWNRAVPAWTMRLSQLAHAVALGLLLLAAAALAGQVYTRASDRTKPVPAAQAFDVEVEPGSTEIERGTSLLVVAHFKGTVPERVSMVIEGLPQGQIKQAMTRSLEDPMFAGRVESVDADLSYRVEFDGQSTETYHVKVYETPELERTDAALAFPQYTGQAAKTVEDIRHVTAVEGTELTLLCRLNKDVTTARLVDEKGAATALSAKGTGGHVYQAAFTLAESHRYRIELIDADGRRNKQKTEIAVNVTRNKPAVVTMTQPAHDVRVSPLEELRLKAQLEDDFGVVRQGVSFTPAGQEPREIVFANSEKPPLKATAEYLLDFESLHAVPDQLVTYYFWAEDIGPDGKPRRTDGDMFFAEVRPFEEIFRQGEQPPSRSAQNDGQQGQNAQQADRLAELQKQIISATWKLIRRETDGKPSSKFIEDAKVIRDSQRAAIEQAAELGGRLRDANSKAELEKATQLMNDAQKRLTEAADGPSLAALRPSLVAEQAAYQALLKLRAREFQVIRNNARQRQGGASGGSPSQRQLDQLELSNDENRFEQQRSARADQNRLSRREQEQRESRQVLNRLRELAQRQSDLNNRLKELQSALEAAKTEEARKEIERQLKRLREQEEQILRDADELRQRMEQEENRQRMEQARQQMEESRQHVREASKALEEGRLSRAITEGARAGQQLNDLRDQVRKETSDRFSTEMTELRKEARQLDENQKKVTDQLDAWNQNPRQTLRDTEERKSVRTGLEQQEAKLDKLLERMRQTVQEAEETEPLLAKSLFDTARKADDQKIPDTLKVTRRLLDAGITDDAAKASQRAGQGIDDLKKGVERAAERILGDETAALRRAQAEVNDLGDQVDREIAQATGQDPNRQLPGSSRAEGQPRQGNRTDPNRPASEGQRGGRDSGQDPQPGQQEQQAGQEGQGDQANAQQPQEARGQNQPGQGQRGQRQQRQSQGLRGRGQQNQQGQDQQGQDQQGENQQVADGQPQGGQSGQRGQNQNRGGGQRQGGGANQRSGLDQLLEGPARGPGGPVTGEGFRQWSDRMRDVEELLDDPELRGQAARIRDRVRGAREEFKRHAKVPDWNQLQSLVAEPLRELGQRIGEEVRRRESPDSLVPIDRDPVPPQYAEGVRRYYERLGSGR